jgi:hypothetical protein
MPLDDSEDLYHLDEHTDVRTRYAEVERVFLEASPRPARAMVLVDRAEPREPHVFVRGDPERRGPVVPRRLPGVLAAVSTEPFEEGSGRLDLARGIVHPANPLTARVIVNRIWAWHFGRGLVTTPSDFGRRSARPSHPELLDYLAGWLIDHGWSLKALHRLILTSMAWQQASLDRPRCRGQDPGNALLWRANRRRLDFEVMRDSMLAVSGRLDSRAGGGPPVREAPDAPDARHRTIYGLLDRELLSSVFRVFDFPSPDISCPERSTTTVPQQALFLLNSPFVLAQADALAERVLCDAPAKGNAEIVRTLFRRVYARAAAEDEVALAVQFLETRRRGSDRVSERALVAELAQVLLQSNEFLFVD